MFKFLLLFAGLIMFSLAGSSQAEITSQTKYIHLTPAFVVNYGIQDA
jgi:hypothetical protein